MKVFYISLVISLLATISGIAQTDSMILQMQELDNVTIVRKRVSSSLKGNLGTTLQWDMKVMHDLPKILGNADPMHYTQLLPGVQTCSEYDAGLHVQGCDNSHNHVAIADVPIYNASHLLGFFSIFNASHFPVMRFEKSPSSASSANRLGGTLSMDLPYTLPTAINGEFSIGPISSQGTFRIPTSTKGSLFVSLRAAYMNLLYGQWLKVDNTQMNYHFQDYNLTYLHQFNGQDKLWLNFYYGNDNVGMTETDITSDIQLKWKNILASALWQHQTENSILTHQLYFTGYDNMFDMQTEGYDFHLPSHIYSYGYKGKWEYCHLEAGIDIAFHHVQPQKPQITGASLIAHHTQQEMKSQEYTCYVDYTQPIGNWTLNGGLRGTFYRAEKNKQYASLDPIISLNYQLNSRGLITLSYGWKHQYLFRTGFSGMGLPTEFWFSCGANNAPQYAQYVTVNYEAGLFDGDYSLSAQAYYKKMYHQVEYKGNMLDFIYTGYDLDNVLLKGEGENYGLNIMLHKRTGRLTGWFGYAWGHAFRRFEHPDYPRIYPASHERPHELNLVATYRLNNRWGIGGTFVYASGTPFTAPKHFYIMDSQLVTTYGEHNANRLKPYSRLDLSVNYNFKKIGQRESGINLSLYNTLAHKNNLFRRMKIYNGKFGYQPVRFFMKVLPSINYYCKF